MAQQRAGVVDATYLESEWNVLEKRLTKLVNLLTENRQKPDAQEFLSLYWTVYNISADDRSAQFLLYHRYGEFLEKYITAVVLPAIQEKDGALMQLEELLKRQENHNEIVRYLSKIFRYLDRSCIPKSGLPSVGEVGRRCFNSLVLQNEQTMHNIVKEAVIGLINSARNGQQIDRGLTENALRFLLQDVDDDDVAEDDVNGAADDAAQPKYKCDLEDGLLDAATQFYQRAASASWAMISLNNIVDEETCAEYMRKIEECKRAERDLVLDPYLKHVITNEEKLLGRIQNELLIPIANAFRNQVADAGSALLTRAAAEVHIDYSCGRRPAAASFAGGGAGSAVAVEKAAQLGLVQNLIDLYDKSSTQIEQLVREAAGCSSKSTTTGLHVRLCKAQWQAFQVVCQQGVKHGPPAAAGRSSTRYTIAELLATFCDYLLKRPTMHAATMEGTVRTVVQLLACDSQQDVFFDSYGRKLARRLLSDHVRGAEVNELSTIIRSFLCKLKHQFGPAFTLNMERMLADFTSAKEKERDYLRAQLQASEGVVDLRVILLKSFYWPSVKSLDHHWSLPAEMAQSVESFQDFYRTTTGQHDHPRKLTWIYPLGTCTVVGHFQGKQMELIVTTLQAAVLLLFNSADSLAYSEIKSMLNVSTDEDQQTLRSLLLSLSCAKFKILCKHPAPAASRPSSSNTATVGPDDRFEFNAEFTHESAEPRIKVPPPAALKEERVVANIQGVEKDRRYALDACLVRVMKRRKVRVPFEQLVAECTEELCRVFQPSLKFIKTRIESLIERAYMVRHANDPNLLDYVP